MGVHMTTPENDMQDYVTKQDIILLESAMRHDVTQMGSAIRHDMTQMESTIRCDMKLLETELKAGMKVLECSLKKDMQHEIGQVERRLRGEMSSHFRWLLSAIIGLLGVMAKGFHWI